MLTVHSQLLSISVISSKLVICAGFVIIIDLSQKSVFNQGTMKHNGIQLYTKWWHDISRWWRGARERRVRRRWWVVGDLCASGVGYVLYQSLLLVVFREHQWTIEFLVSDFSRFTATKTEFPANPWSQNTEEYTIYQTLSWCTKCLNRKG